MEIIEPLVSIMAAMKVDFITVDSCGVIVPAGWLLAKCFGLAPADQVVEVQHVEVVKRFLSVPSPEDVKVV